MAEEGVSYRVFHNTYMSSARTRVTRVRASVRIQRMVKMRELAREVRDSERTDERRPPPPAHRPSATQPILCHLKQKAHFPLLCIPSAVQEKRMSSVHKSDTKSGIFLRLCTTVVAYERAFPWNIFLINQIINNSISLPLRYSHTRNIVFFDVLWKRRISRTTG